MNRTKLPILTFWRAVLLLIFVGGIYSSVLRFAGGLGSSTALSDEFPWGLWVGFDVLCGVGLAAGGFTLAERFMSFTSTASMRCCAPRFSLPSWAMDW